MALLTPNTTLADAINMLMISPLIICLVWCILDILEEWWVDDICHKIPLKLNNEEQKIFNKIKHLVINDNYKIRSYDRDIYIAKDFTYDYIFCRRSKYTSTSTKIIGLKIAFINKEGMKLYDKEGMRLYDNNGRNLIPYRRRLYSKVLKFLKDIEKSDEIIRKQLEKNNKKEIDLKVDKSLSNFLK